MERIVKVFVIPKDRSPSGPPDPPWEMVIEAGCTDGLRAAARARLEAEVGRIRALSFTPEGLVAYVEEVAP